MDGRFVVEASQSLEEYTQKEKIPANTYIGELPKDTAQWLDRFEVVEISEPRCWRLIRRLDDGQSEEAVFSLHELPPVTELPRMGARSHPFLRQSVTLTGLSTDVFEAAVDRSQEVYNKFQRFFPENQLLPWGAMNCTITDGRTLTFSNRYFTRRQEAPTIRAIPFTYDVDPKRLLTQLVTGHLFHSSDNEVSYYTRYKDEDHQLVHDFTNPQTFRIGDIVDVQFSFVVYRMRTGEHIMKPMLFSIALVNGQFSDAYTQRMKMTTSSANPAVKRRTGYDTARPSKIRRTETVTPDGSGNVEELPTVEMKDMRI
ncbi:hypothetical protein BDN72DRAFT_904311 [Pluteus cervinus]|uniref:Uncharacterized protein n=1 Tax=Pluteus cervinus TaxID=181527 RepID=A0ACD3A656_9AGAR|nr:hypothetical protein BDN72DRAFT_904311 [Pluteus cervinus]